MNPQPLIRDECAQPRLPIELNVTYLEDFLLVFWAFDPRLMLRLLLLLLLRVAAVGPGVVHRCGRDGLSGDLVGTPTVTA